MSVVSLKKYQTYESFRATEDAWLSSIPANWKLTRLQFNSSIRNSGVDKKIVEGEELIKLCNYVDVYYHDIIDDSIDFMEASATDEEIKNFRLREGDVIMTKDSESPDDIGIPAYVSKDFDNVVCGYHLCVLKTERDKLQPKFLFYFLKSNYAQSKFEIYSNGVTRFGLSYNGIKTLPVPTPSLSEQQSIANFLDQKTKQIDDLIEQKEKLLALLTEKRTAIITQAVIKGLDPNVKMKDSEVEWLGDVPEHWDVKKLKYLTETIKTGITPSSNGPDYFTDGTINWYSPGDFDDESLTLKDPVKKLDKLVFSDTGQRKFPAHSILVVGIGATLGKVGLALRACTSNQQINAIYPSKKFNSKFLTYFLASQTEIMRLFSNSTTLGILNQEKTKNLMITVPPITEQVLIAEHLDRIVSVIGEVITKTADSIDKLKEYRVSLITSAVTGQIDVRKEAFA